MEVVFFRRLSFPGEISICATENIKILSDCLGLSVSELTIVVMDRARHKDLISENRNFIIASGSHQKRIALVSNQIMKMI